MARDQWTGISDKELLRAYRAGKQLGRTDATVVAELRRRGFRDETDGEPTDDATPHADAIVASLEKVVVAHASPSGTMGSESYGMSLFGGALFFVGLYFLFNPSSADSSQVVNLQKLTWGETFTISGAIFLAVSLRPRG